MLEGIVEPRHLREFDGTVEILGEPKLLEMGDVPHVPDDRAHQWVVLLVQILVRQLGYEQQCPVAGFREEVGDFLLRRRSRGESRCCGLGGSHGRCARHSNDTAVSGTCQPSDRFCRPFQGWLHYSLFGKHEWRNEGLRSLQAGTAASAWRPAASSRS